MSRLWKSVAIMTAVLALAGCGDKKKDPKAAGESKPEVIQTIPKDDASQSFGRFLLNHPITELVVNESPSTKLVYTQMTFEKDNSWAAKAQLRTLNESVDCVEGGTWSMDPADGPKKATLSVNVARTNCASRDPGVKMRLGVTVSEGKYDIQMR